MIQYKHILITLALLLTAVTGAWATTDPNSVYWYGGRETWNGWAESVTTHTVGDITITCSGNAKAYESTTSGEPLVLQADANDAITFTSNGKPFASIKIQTGDEVNVAGWTWVSSEWTLEWSGEPTTSVTLSGCYILADMITFTFGTAEAPVTVDWTASTKTGTFAMPGSDVVLTPQYAPAAQLDENGAPAAVSGLEIAADAAIITAGQSAQGTLLYAVTTSAEAAPALTAFAAALPNAKDQTAAGNYYVWYYIQGHDTPQGQEPTAENTFNDSEIMGPVMVELLTNEHTLNIKQSPNITVTVAGTAKTPTDDKVTPVTTGQEVKIKAKEGYKFRKVEVKKGAKAPTTAQLNVPTGWNGDNTNVTANDLPGFVALTDEEAANIPCPDAEGYVYVIHNFVGDGYIRIIAFYNGERQGQQSHTLARYHDEIYYDVNDNQIKYYYTTGK